MIGRDDPAHVPHIPPMPAANTALPLTEEKVRVIRRATVWAVAKDALYTVGTLALATFVARVVAGNGTGQWLWLLARNAVRSLGDAVASGDTAPLVAPGPFIGLTAGAILLLGVLTAVGFVLRRVAGAARAVRDYRRDLRDGAYLVATGPFTVSEHRIGTGQEKRRYWMLALHDCTFPVPRRVFEALRTHSSGSVAYSRYSRHVIAVRDPEGYIVYTAPGYDTPIH